ncbi:hypothetical protein JCM16303_005482 [Sporobolomyces ruberrimus]
MTEAPSTWPSPHEAGRLNRTDALAYLERINLPSSLLDETPSLDLLTRLQTAHLLSVPFESTTVHVKNWHDDEADLTLGGGVTVPLSEPGFNHIVNLRRGGYCFLLNGTFPSLLRALGFNVSECLAKVNIIRKDPEVHGVDWEALSHHVCIVDWQGSNERYLCDVGFGAGPTSPTLLQDGAEATSIPSTDVYRLSRHETFPYVSPSLVPDQSPAWMVSRRILSETSTPSERKYLLIPQYAFQLLSTTHRDVLAMNHFQSTCPTATFYNLFVSTLLRSNGERITLSYHKASVDENGKKAAKLTRTRLITQDKNDEVLETKYVPAKVGSIRRVLEDEFGMSFPKDYPGN